PRVLHELRVDLLDRHFALQFDVVRAVDRGEIAAADGALDLITTFRFHAFPPAVLLYTAGAGNSPGKRSLISGLRSWFGQYSRKIVEIDCSSSASVSSESLRLLTRPSARSIRSTWRYLAIAAA